MVISDGIPDVAVTIKAGDETLHEYLMNDDSDDNEAVLNNKVIRYIEAVPGQKFAVHATLHAIPPDIYHREEAPLFVEEDEDDDETRAPAQYGLGWSMSIDGREMEPVLAHEQMVQAYYSPTRTCLSDGISSGANQVRHYQFSAIEEGGSERQHIGKDRLDELGTIKIVVHHVKVCSTVTRESFDSRDIRTLDEKATKGRKVERSASLAEAIAGSRAAVHYDSIPLDPDNPAAIYDFRYRSKGMCAMGRTRKMRLGMLTKTQRSYRSSVSLHETRPQSSSMNLRPNPQNQDPLLMTPDELIAEILRRRAADAEQDRVCIKQEVRDRDANDEHTPRRTAAGGISDVILDLTGDGDEIAEIPRPAAAVPTMPTVELE